MLNFGITGLLAVFAAGAATMYFVDETSGAGRRATVRGKLAAAEKVSSVTRDLASGTRGVLARVGSSGVLAKVSEWSRFWTPTTRFLVGATGAVCVARGVAKGFAALAHLAFGSALIAASVVDRAALQRKGARARQRIGTIESDGVGAIVPT